MTLFFIRVLFLIISGSVGYYLGLIKNEPWLGAEIGCLGALILILIERLLKSVSVRGLSSMVFGLLLGLLMAKLISNILHLIPMSLYMQSVTEIILMVVFSYLGSVMALRGKDEFNLIIPYVRFRRQDVKDGVILLDSSAIIDGRIADIYKINFLLGRLVVPRFILKELQTLADSSDDLKREKGRRGLELLKMMQGDPKIDIHIHEPEAMNDGDDTDAKLVKLAKFMDAKICTTDYNLSQAAGLQGIAVLNVYELVNAVRSVVFTGEKLMVKLIKQGKEPHQAVAYLDDGTMVVVNHAGDAVGKKVDVVVSSVIQTSAGKIIFADRA